MAQLQSTTVCGNTTLDRACQNTGGSGYLWFNTGTQRLNYTFFSPGGSATWTSTAQMITPRRLAGGIGTVSAALSMPGYRDGSGIVNCVEAWNGSAWSSRTGMIISGFYTAAAGTQNAALSTGRYNGPGVRACTELYNGSTWSSGGALGVARFSVAMAGTPTAGLAFFGVTPATVGCTERYNGTSWSSASGGISGRWRAWGSGTQNAAVIFGGTPATNLETFNGTSWSTTAGSVMIVGRQLLAGASNGSSTSTLAFGGYNTCTTNESWNGTSWSSATALISGRMMNSGAGTSNQSALAFNGYQGGSKFYPAPEVYSAPAPFGINVCVL